MSLIYKIAFPLNRNGRSFCDGYLNDQILSERIKELMEEGLYFDSLLRRIKKPGYQLSESLALCAKNVAD